MTILRKVTRYRRDGVLELSCGHETAPVPSHPRYGWAPCSTCGLTRHMRTTGREGAAIARAAGKAAR